MKKLLKKIKEFFCVADQINKVGIAINHRIAKSEEIRQKAHAETVELMQASNEELHSKIDELANKNKALAKKVEDLESWLRLLWG